MAKFSKRDYKYFEMARKEAMNSTYDGFKLGSVLVYQGRVISTGHNSDKTHPMQAYYNKKYRKFRYSGTMIKHSLHSEIACLVNIPKCIDVNIDYSRASLYIYRIAPGKPLHMGRSFPCPACLNALRDKGIRHIYYTDDNGLAYQELY